MALILSQILRFQFLAKWVSNRMFIGRVRRSATSCTAAARIVNSGRLKNSKMFQDAKLYSENHLMPKVDCSKLLDSVLPQMVFGEDDIVLDIGCGSGDNTRDIIRARIPKLKTLVAIDVLPQMIDFARKHNADKRIEYHLADIEDRSSLKRWEGSISKAFSVHCFQILKNQRNAFQSLFSLLKPNGEAAFVFILSIRIWDPYPIIINDEKWNKYLKDADKHVPDSHHLHLGADYYSKLLEELGFEIIMCKEENRKLVYNDDSQLRNCVELFSALPSYIPENLREQFADELFSHVVKLNGRNSEGQLTSHYKTLTVHVRKP